MKNTSVMLIETISLLSKGNCAVLEKQRKDVLESFTTHKTVQQREKKWHHFKIMSDILHIGGLLNIIQKLLPVALRWLLS